MKLEELAALGVAAPGPRPNRVPGWTLGCFRRRAITFFTGATDVATRVYWLQSQGLTADLRLPARLPALAGVTDLAEAPPEHLLAMAQVEGGLARTEWDAATTMMAWSDWTSFQLHDKWPEPGRLARVGDCLIEHAPSGAYVEDWRLQPSRPGALIGLRLLEQRDLATGEVRHRGGGLVVCGDHAALVLGRPRALPGDRPLGELVRRCLDDWQLLRAVFGFEASVGKRAGPGADFIVEASSNPLREGQALLNLDGFSYDPQQGHVVQRVEDRDDQDGGTERIFSIDTLESGFQTVLATPATPAAQHWLHREAATLLAAAQPPRSGE